MKNRELMLNAINNFYQRSYKQNLEISELECEVILVRHPLDINELYIAEISVNVEHNALCYSITNEDSAANSAFISPRMCHSAAVISPTN